MCTSQAMATFFLLKLFLFDTRLEAHRLTEAFKLYIDDNNNTAKKNNLNK